MDDFDPQPYIEQITELAIAYAPKVLLALITLIIGFWIINRVCLSMDRMLGKRGADQALSHFLNSLISVGLKGLLLISVASMIGIETTSFIAVFGAAGLAIGLALQGSLSNFAGGVLILLFKPYKIDDVIEAQGFLGRVVKIQIFNTILNTMDNERIIIPNGLLSNGPIRNLFAEEIRRVESTFGISYEDSIDQAREVIAKIVDANDHILGDPGPEIFVSEHADSSVNLLVRVWVKTDDYWPVHFDLIEQVKKEFDNNNITIPFPQRDVHMAK
jgi:small conductance mechanosensitive channel